MGTNAKMNHEGYEGREGHEEEKGAVAVLVGEFRLGRIGKIPTPLKGKYSENDPGEALISYSCPALLSCAW